MISGREKRWRIREPDPASVAGLSETGLFSPFTARLLVNRGITEPAAASRFVSAVLGDLHDPFLFSGMERAVERLVLAARKRERVCVYGDYDVDGVTAVALLTLFFRSVGIDCFYHIPRRMEDGYGLSIDGIGSAVERGAKVIVTVDCGTTAVKEALYCREIGADIIVTDHHMPGDDLPEALALINPLQKGCRFPFKQPAGVGVAFNLVIALRNRLRSAGWFAGVQEPDVREFLDLVALGTVADMVPLLDENRVFVKYGLTALSTTPRIGIKALKEVAGVSGDVGCGAIGFRLAPRLNAAGRLENAALGVELLLCEDPQRAAVLAAELDANNAARQALEQEILQEALAIVANSPVYRDRKSIVLASEDWHPGVIGIVASRIVDVYHRPTVLIALQNGSGRGSARSIPGFHLYDALHACSEHLVKFGGHKYAAGLSIDEATLTSFVAQFEEIASGLLTPSDLTPELVIDGELHPSQISAGLVEEIRALGPFGIGNPEPSFVMRDIEVREHRLIKEHHLKLRLQAGKNRFDAIGFNLARKRGAGEGRVDIAFTLETDGLPGRFPCQLRLKDIKASGMASWETEVCTEQGK